MKDINPNYVIYRDGRIFSLANNAFIKPMKAGNGRGFCVDIRYTEGTGNRRRWMINQLVYHYFVKKINLLKDDYVIAHKDRDQTNYSLSNLIKVSRKSYIKEQMKRKIIDRSKYPTPKKPPKLTPEQDKDVYNLVKSGQTKRSLATEYGVSEMSILRAYRRHESTIH